MPTGRLLFEVNDVFFFLSAPSQPPVKVMWNTSNSKIILNWEQVKALENESEVTGYKVSTQSLGFIRKLCLLPLLPCSDSRLDLRRSSSGALQKESPQSPQRHGNQHHLCGARPAHRRGLYHPDKAVRRGRGRQQQQADHHPKDTRSVES